MISTSASERDIKSAKTKAKKLGDELGELAVFRNTIKDYFIERIVFPGIYNKQNKNTGFDLVIDKSTAKLGNFSLRQSTIRFFVNCSLS